MHWRSVFESDQYIKDEKVVGLNEITKEARVEREERRPGTELGTLQLCLQGKVEESIKETGRE